MSSSRALSFPFCGGPSRFISTAEELIYAFSLSTASCLPDFLRNYKHFSDFPASWKISDKFWRDLEFEAENSEAMDALRHADARVQQATHPRGTTRWRMQRYNPMNRLRWKKNRVTHPVGYQKAKTRARLNYINPLFYIRRIKRNLTGVGHRRRTTTVY